jgi:hypothetical protein
MSNEDLATVIKEAVKSAVHDELGAYKVPKEQHYQDHYFLQGLREWIGDVRQGTVKAFVYSVIVGLATLIVLGFQEYFKK